MALWLTMWTVARLRTGPRRFECLEGSPSWRQFRACEWRQSIPSHSFRPPFSGRRSLRTVFSHKTYVAFLWCVSDCHGNSSRRFRTPDESPHFRRTPADGSGGRLQAVSRLRGRRPPESPRISSTNTRSVREIPALRPGTGRGTSLAGKFSRILAAAGTAPAGSGAGVHAIVLFRVFLEHFQRRGLVSSFGSSLTSAISSASSAPGSGWRWRGVADPVEEGEAAVAGVGEGTASAESRPYLEPTRCTLN